MRIGNAVIVVGVLLSVTSAVGRLEAQETGWVDRSSHRTTYVMVDEGVELEILDWGGTGRPLVLLAGLGMTAHVFDAFAPDLTRHGHVYGVTRRGFGDSTKPAEGYSPDRLADDVLTVIEILGLEGPVVIGHSIAGQELSSLGTRYPMRIAGLVYLDALARYSFLPPDVEEEIDALPPPPAFPPSPPEPSEADLESFSALRAYFGEYLGYAPPESELRRMFSVDADGGVGEYQVNPDVATAILSGTQRHVGVQVPSLVIVPSPHGRAPWTFKQLNSDQSTFEQARRWGQRRTEVLATGFERHVASARIVRIPDADHHVYGSHPEIVLREIQGFLTELD